MQLTLTDDEARTLKDLLRDYLPELKREVARTEAHDFRHLLVGRLDLCERLIAELQRAGV